MLSVVLPPLSLAVFRSKVNAALTGPEKVELEATVVTEVVIAGPPLTELAILLPDIAPALKLAGS